MTRSEIIWICGGLALAAGCADEALFFVPRPDTGSARSVILTILPADGPPISRAFDAPFDRLMLPVETDFKGDAVLHAALFSCDTDAIGLRKGDNLLWEKGTPIPSAPKELVLELAGGESSGWHETSERPDSVARIRIERDASSLCAQFAVNQVPIPASSTVREVVRLTERRTLLVTTSSRAYVLHDDNRVEMEYLPFAASRGVFERSRDELYVADRGGNIRVGSFAGGFVDAPTMVGPVSHTGHYFLAGSREDPFALFGVGYQSTFERYDGTTWTAIATSSASSSTSVFKALVALSDTEAIALTVGESSYQVVHYVDGAVFQETLTSNANALKVAALARPGPVVGSRLGVVFVLRDGSWTELVVEETAESIRVLAPLDEGVLMGGEAGNVQQYSALCGMCELMSVGESKINYLLPRENGFLAVGSVLDDVIELVRRNPRPLCDEPIIIP